MGKTKCKISVVEESGPFVNSIPESIRNEIQEVVKETKKTDREQSLTFCQLNNKIFVSDHAVGDENSTYSLPCNAAHGPHTTRIGDLHTHPTQDSNTVGITPSNADIISTVEDSVQAGVPQISCITSNDSKMIHCYQPKPKLLYDKEKINQYRKSLYYDSDSVDDVPPFLRENLSKDFDHAWYSRTSFKRIKEPDPKEIVHDAFIHSRKILRLEAVDEFSKGAFCDLIQDLSLPQDDRVANECRKALKIRSILGFRF